jgi:hypothetical protein
VSAELIQHNDAGKSIAGVELLLPHRRFCGKRMEAAETSLNFQVELTSAAIPLSLHSSNVGRLVGAVLKPKL